MSESQIITTALHFQCTINWLNTVWKGLNLCLFWWPSLVKKFTDWYFCLDMETKSFMFINIWSYSFIFSLSGKIVATLLSTNFYFQFQNNVMYLTDICTFTINSNLILIYISMHALLEFFHEEFWVIYVHVGENHRLFQFCSARWDKIF